MSVPKQGTLYLCYTDKPVLAIYCEKHTNTFEGKMQNFGALELVMHINHHCGLKG
jgi:hypothetical protein